MRTNFHYLSPKYSQNISKINNFSNYKNRYNTVRNNDTSINFNNVHKPILQRPNLRNYLSNNNKVIKKDISIDSIKVPKINNKINRNDVMGRKPHLVSSKSSINLNKMKDIPNQRIINNNKTRPFFHKPSIHNKNQENDFNNNNEIKNRLEKTNFEGKNILLYFITKIYFS